MKLKSLLFLALAAVLTLAVPRTARAQDVSFDFFYDSLAPMGEWIEVGDYGYCWRPSDVDEDWAPYSDGYWSYTDAGWTWVSYEDFGGIVYHYGRWAKVEDEGWVWVPDYEWGPAWVSWRRSDDYVGWAPLPVEARWEQDRGFSTWVDTSYDIAPTYYNFCHTHDFGAPVLRPLIIRRSQNFVIINNTVNITNITYNNNAGCVFNGGLDYGYVNRFAQRPIPALKLVRNTNIRVVNNTIINNNVRITNFNSVQRGNQLTVIAPRVNRPPQAQIAALMQPKISKVIPQGKVTKGWAGVPAEQRAQIRAQRISENKGLTPETARAKPLKLSDLQVVPEKADPNAKVAQPPRRGPNRPQPGVGNPDAEAITKTPSTLPNTPNGVPTPNEPGRITGPGKKGGRPTPMPANPQAITNNPPTEVPPNTVPDRVKPVRPGITKPFVPNEDNNRPDGTAQTPNRPGAPITNNPPTDVPPSGVPDRVKPVRPGITKPFVPNGENNPPASTVQTPNRPGAPITNKPPTDVPPNGVPDRVKPVRPGITKPFVPNGENNPPASTVQTPNRPNPVRPMTPPVQPNNDVLDQRKAAAAEVAAKKQAAQEALRQRSQEQNQQQEMTRRNNAQEALAKQQQAQAQAAARQQALQQRQNAPDAVRQMPVQADPQAAIRTRQAQAAQAAENRQRVQEAQQAQAARKSAAAAQIQQQPPVQRPQVQREQPQVRPQMQPRPQTQVQPPPQIQQRPQVQPRPQVAPQRPQNVPQKSVPGRPGKPVNPEDLKNQ